MGKLGVVRNDRLDHRQRYLGMEEQDVGMEDPDGTPPNRGRLTATSQSEERIRLANIGPSTDEAVAGEELTRSPGQEGSRLGGDTAETANEA